MKNKIFFEFPDFYLNVNKRSQIVENVTNYDFDIFFSMYFYL